MIFNLCQLANSKNKKQPVEEYLPVQGVYVHKLTFPSYIKSIFLKNKLVILKAYTKNYWSLC